MNSEIRGLPKEVFGILQCRPSLFDMLTMFAQLCLSQILLRRRPWCDILKRLIVKVTNKSAIKYVLPGG